MVVAGFHHSSDERDLDDPSIHEPYAMVASSRWDALFDAPAGSKDVKVLAASYGVRDGEILSKGEVGLGIKWVEEGEDVREARVSFISPSSFVRSPSFGDELTLSLLSRVRHYQWAWIGGELEEQDDDEEDADEEAGEKEDLPRYKGVHLVRAPKEEDDEDDAGVDIAVF